MILPIQNKKKLFIISAVIILLTAVALCVYLFFFRKPIQTVQNPPETQITHLPCLTDNEYVDYPLDPKYDPVIKAPKLPLILSIRDKESQKEKFSFQIDGVSEDYYPFELYKCSIYVIREFNHDPKKSKHEIGYKEELWKYDYSGSGKPLLLLAEKPKEFISYYDPDFRVDPTEIYITLIRGGYVERPDYALVIKNLDTLTDDFELLHRDLLSNYPDLLGTFGLRTWTKKGDYFWADIFSGAVVDAFLRISRGDWKVDVLTPFGVSSVLVNYENGYATYDTGPGWIGIDIIKKQVYDEWRKEGKKIDFYVYNLFTKEKTLLATIDDPAWSFKPQWISDTELEYALPNGEEKVYKIK